MSIIILSICIILLNMNIFLIRREIKILNFKIEKLENKGDFKHGQNNKHN